MPQPCGSVSLPVRTKRLSGEKTTAAHPHDGLVGPRPAGMDHTRHGLQIAHSRHGFVSVQRYAAHNIPDAGRVVPASDCDTASIREKVTALIDPNSQQSTVSVTIVTSQAKHSITGRKTTSPCGAKATAITALGGLERCRSSPLLVSQSRAVPSALPVRIERPSGAKATDVTR